jgi:hypothetical protein
MSDALYVASPRDIGTRPHQAVASGSMPLRSQEGLQEPSIPEAASVYPDLGEQGPVYPFCTGRPQPIETFGGCQPPRARNEVNRMKMIVIASAAILAIVATACGSQPSAAPTPCIDMAKAMPALSDAEAKLASYQALLSQQTTADLLSKSGMLWHGIAADYFTVATATAGDPTAAAAAEQTGHDANLVASGFDDAATAFAAGDFSPYQADLSSALDGMNAEATDSADAEAAIKATNAAACK